MRYGYIRCKGENSEGELFQQELLGAVDVDEIYIDRNLGEWVQYEEMLSRLAGKDLVYIASINLLGNTIGEISQRWNELYERDVVLMMMNLPECKSAESYYAVTRVLDELKKKESHRFRKLQQRGFERARESGIHLGRPRVSKPREFDDVYALTLNGTLTSKEAMERLNLSPSSYYKLAREEKERQMTPLDKMW